jgi:phosphoglycolate phosphatase
MRHLEKGSKGSEETVLKIKPLPLAGVIFDFDGTLAKLNIDFAEMRAAILALAVDYGVTTIAIERMHVLEMIEAVRKMLVRKEPQKEDCFFADAYAIISAIEIRAANEGSLLAGIKEMLMKLKKRGIKSGVVTRNCGEAVSVIFPDISSHCDAFIPREHINHVKPHPEHLLMILKLLKVLPEQAIMVGDHPLDIEAGKNAGVLTAGVLTGNSSREALECAGADYIFNSAVEIINILPSQIE